MVSILVPNMYPWKLPYSSSSFPEMHLVMASLEMKKYSSPLASSFLWGLVVSVRGGRGGVTDGPDQSYSPKSCGVVGVCGGGVLTCDRVGKLLRVFG